ncbi:MAG TPA: sigma-70 family RNA polymerase sigma factor [Blastocatellia bacterium]|nr:sigma-70 family RNA polymerase sigma factor [Blastocatellia bacterium]
MEPSSLSSTRQTGVPHAGNQDWTSLIRAIASGDQAALGTLYDATSRVVFGLALRILNDRATAEEVMLDVYTQVWRQAASYDLQRGSPMAWLMTIARSRAIDRLRSGWQDQQRREPLEVIGDARSDSISPELSTEISERRLLVRKALSAISPEQRELIEMAYYGGLSHSEIALQTNLPLGTVKTRIRLGMLKLREMLGPALEGMV